MKVRKIVNKIGSIRRGVTLIELIVAMAIVSIVMGAVIGLVSITYRSFNISNTQADVQNLSVLTVQKIQDTLRYASQVRITDLSSGDGIYYDSMSDGIHMGSTVFLKNSFKGYTVTFNFSNQNPGTDTLLGIGMTIFKNGQPVCTQNTSEYLLNGKITAAPGGNALTYAS